MPAKSGDPRPLARRVCCDPPLQGREIIVLGYDPAQLPGGVSTTTTTLLQSMPNARLHPIKHCYGPLDIWLYAVSLVRFGGVVLRRRKSILTHLIVGSRGDRVRAIPILLLCALFRVPLCIQYHTSAANMVLKPGSRRDRLIDRIFWLADLHVFLSPALRTEFVNRTAVIGRSLIIPNALKPAWMNQPITPLEERDIDVVYFGRWAPEKGVAVLLEYMRSTSTPPRCEIYSDQACDIGIKNVVVKPWVPEHEVRAILNRSKLLVLPSYAEAYPTVILEALACGTPFVATNVGGIPDIANASEAGVLIEPGDWATLGHSIEMMLASPEDWTRCSQFGHAWANKTCDAGRVASLWREAYRELAKERP